MKERVFKLKEYTYDELSDTAKEKAYECFLNEEYNWGCPTLDYWADDMCGTMEEFGRIFEVGYKDWEVDYNGYIIAGVLRYPSHSIWYNYDNDELKGARLMAYIWNNFGDYIERGKYYSKRFVNKYRRSKVTMSRDCVLTGVYYDNIILAPIYDFLDGKGDMNMTAHELLEECYYGLLKAFVEECEHFWTKDNFLETYAHEWTYNEDGTLFSAPSYGIDISDVVEEMLASE